MSRIATNLTLAITISIVCGCASRRQCPPPACSPYVSEKTEIIVAPISNEGVGYDFSGIPNYESVKQSLFDKIATGGSIPISLQDVVCLAAKNSEAADLLEAERYAIACQSRQATKERSGSIDLILQGEALEQRNISAGAAAELFLRLVEVELQSALLVETKQHLAKLRETTQAADEAGFATADAKNELANSDIEIKETESKLSAAKQELMFRLNQMVNADLDNPIDFRVSHMLRPEAIPFNIKQQNDIASSNRPGVRAAEMAIANGVGTNSIYKLLSQFDSRIGVQLTPASIKSKFLRKQVLDMLKPNEENDTTIETRKVQLQQIVDARRMAARAEVSKALLEIQTALEGLAIAQEDIDRLNIQAEQLESKKELERDEAMIESNQNWVQRQKAKSKRVTLAIEHEIATIKLFQAQGELIRECGFQLDETANNCNCP
ncbi:MAG: hypothetical protein AB8B55_13875 [Mariniblastus sp.]